MKTQKEIRELLEERKNTPSVFDEQALMIYNFDDLAETCLALYAKLEEMEKTQRGSDPLDDSCPHGRTTLENCSNECGSVY